MTKQVGDSGLLNTWAANGTVVDPETVSAGKTDLGWTSGERPPFQFFNWLLNSFGKKINYLLRSGVPAWNAGTAYLENDLATLGGEIYRASGNTQGESPADGEPWVQLTGQTEEVSEPHPVESQWKVGNAKPTFSDQGEDGWMFCNGAAISRTTYAALFAAIGTKYGAGNGSTTFNLPDVRERAAFGAGNMGGASSPGRITSASGFPDTSAGKSGGSELMQAHGHSGSTNATGSHDHTESQLSNTQISYASGNNKAQTGEVRGNTGSAGNHSHSLNISNAGSGNSQNMPPSIFINWLIKVS